MFSLISFAVLNLDMCQKDCTEAEQCFHTHTHTQGGNVTKLNWSKLITRPLFSFSKEISCSLRNKLAIISQVATWKQSRDHSCCFLLFIYQLSGDEEVSSSVDLPFMLKIHSWIFQQVNPFSVSVQKDHERHIEMFVRGCLQSDLILKLRCQSLLWTVCKCQYRFNLTPKKITTG